MNDIFGPGSNLSTRFIPDYQQLSEKIQFLKNIGMEIILTSGTFDLFHMGHGRYLEKAKQSAKNFDKAILVVGVDSDERVRDRKGPDRPIVSENERVETICHSRYADLVTLKRKEDQKWELIKIVSPDILIISERTKYSDEEIILLDEWCGKVVALESQATTSTSAKVRLLHINFSEKMKKEVLEHLDITKDKIVKIFDATKEAQGKGGKNE